MSAKQRMRVPETVHSRAFDEELIILDLAAGQYFSLDPIGSAAWSAFADGKCADEISVTIAEEYDVDRGEALKDVLDLASELLSLGLLIPHGEAP